MNVYSHLLSTSCIMKWIVDVRKAVSSIFVCTIFGTVIVRFCMNWE